MKNMIVTVAFSSLLAVGAFACSGSTDAGDSTDTALEQSEGSGQHRDDRRGDDRRREEERRPGDDRTAHEEIGTTSSEKTEPHPTGDGRDAAATTDGGEEHHRDAGIELHDAEIHK